MKKKLNKIICLMVTVITILLVSSNSFAWSNHDSSDLCPVTGINKAAIIQKGARYPDTEASGLKGMGHYPQFHGGKAYINSDGSWGNDSNYIASYIYLTRVALLNGNPSNLATISSTKDDAYNVIKQVFSNNKINGVEWSKALSPYAVNDANKKAFIWGMAIHTVTDVYAHSSYKKLSDGTYSYIAHGKTPPYPADTISETPKRYECAKQIAKLAVLRYKNSEEGSMTDFTLSTSGYYDGSFKIRNLCSYAHFCNASLYDACVGTILLPGNIGTLPN